MKPVAMTLLALALSGCSLAPTYERPAAPVPARYDTPAQAGQATAPQDWRGWYALAHAYDLAGDRKRARSAMRHAIDLEGGDPA